MSIADKLRRRRKVEEGKKLSEPRKQEVRPVEMIVVHCSDSPDWLKDYGAKEIDAHHRNNNGWDSIGYHYVVKRDGTIEKGRKESKIGAHVRGHNTKSLGLCWIGRDKPTRVQWTALKALTRELMDKYGLTKEQVYGHFELDPHKTCPNIDVKQFRAEL